MLPAENESGTQGWNPQPWSLLEIAFHWASFTTGHKKVSIMWFSTALKIFECLLRNSCYQAKQSAGGVELLEDGVGELPGNFRTQTSSSQLLFF